MEHDWAEQMEADGHMARRVRRLERRVAELEERLSAVDVFMDRAIGSERAPAPAKMTETRRVVAA